MNRRIPTPQRPSRHAALHGALKDLRPTRNGFEGLVADLVGAITGGTVRLLSSGDQRGVDALGDLGAPEPRLAMQAKRYGARSALDLTSLMGEMARAAAAFPSIELWVLATTREVRAKEHDSLAREAELRGWAFLALDWADQNEGVPYLAAACAAFPRVTERYLTDPNARLELAEIVSSGAWRAPYARLKDVLDSATASFQNLCGLAKSTLARFHEDAAFARRMAGPSPSLLASAPPISRDRIRTIAADWARGRTQALALLGGEGVGKTWAGLDLLQQIGAADEQVAPLVIHAEMALRKQDALSAVVDILVTLGVDAGLRIQEPTRFWRTKLDRWRRAGPGGPTLLVLIDGLDEAPTLAWTAFVAPLLEAQYDGLFRIIFTCREEAWNAGVTLSLSPSLSVQTERLTGFTEHERDRYLASRGVDIADLSPDVLTQATHPRTAFHLSRLVHELPDLKRLTREQLLLRDYQNLRLVKDGRDLTSEAFEALVQGLARDAQATALRQGAFSFTRGELARRGADLSGRDGGSMQQLISDFVSGAWCRPDPASPVALVFRDDALPAAVGIALAHAIRNLTTANARLELARFLEPWSADDLTEAVLRMCATILISDPKAPEPLCRLIVDVWRQRPLRSDLALDGWRRLHVFRPGLFLEKCRVPGGVRGDDLGEWGIAALWNDHPSCRALVEAELCRWAGRFPPLTQHSNSHPDITRHLNFRLRRHDRRTQILAHMHPGRWRDELTFERRSGAASHLEIALRIIIQCPRRPFALAFTHWALVAALMRHASATSQVANALRQNPQDRDATFDALREIAAAFVAQGDRVSQRAAGLLLDAASSTTPPHPPEVCAD